MENIVIKISSEFPPFLEVIMENSLADLVSFLFVKRSVTLFQVLLYHALSCRGDDGSYYTRIGNSREVKIGLWKVIQKSVMEEELLGKQRCVLRRFKGMLIISPIIILFL